MTKPKKEADPNFDPISDLKPSGTETSESEKSRTHTPEINKGSKNDYAKYEYSKK